MIKLLSILFLLIILPILYLTYNRNWIYLQLLPQQKYSCSFDDISACQLPNVTNRTFLYIIHDRAGFCSEMNQVLLAFAYSVATKRRFLIDSRKWNYGNFTDYFHLPSTNYYPQTYSTFLLKNNRQNDLVHHLKTTRTGTQIGNFWTATRQVQLIEIKRRVAHYLWKSMSKETFKFIEKCRITNLSNYIGIHIRKGDKLVREAPEIPLNKYIESIELILHTNKTIQHIFVASDDGRAIQQLRQLKPKWNFVSIHDKNRKKMNKTGHFQSLFNRLSSREKRVDTRLFMCELQMLIDSQYVVCGMSSNVCRFVQILRHHHPSTAISLDKPWYGT